MREATTKMKYLVLSLLVLCVLFFASCGNSKVNQMVQAADEDRFAEAYRLASEVYPDRSTLDAEELVSLAAVYAAQSTELTVDEDDTEVYEARAGECYRMAMKQDAEAVKSFFQRELSRASNEEERQAVEGIHTFLKQCANYYK